MWQKEQEAAGHVAHTISEQREMEAGAQLALSFKQSGYTWWWVVAAPWVVPLQLVESRSSRVSYRLVSMLILKSITLSIEVSHYSTL